MKKKQKWSDMMSLEGIIKEVEEIAAEHFDGHYSFFNFTTNCIFSFGTIDYLHDTVCKNMVKNTGLRDIVAIQREYLVYGKTMDDAMKKGIQRWRDLDDSKKLKKK